MTQAATIIDDTTPGFYNAGIGTLLNGTDPAFPVVGDPTLTLLAAPDLSAAATELGGWLDTPPDLSTAGSTWSATPTAIPFSWAIGTETAIVYEFDAGSGLSGVSLEIGVDNGIIVWLDGGFVGGELRPGTAVAGEHVFDLGDLSGGTHHLQLLREDHGGIDGYTVKLEGTPVTSVPEPGATLPLACLAMISCMALRRRI